MRRTGIALMISMLSLAAVASTTSVVPTAIIASESSRVEVFTINNKGDNEATFNITVHTLAADGSMTFSKDFLISPSIVKIPAKEKRVVRIGRTKPGVGYYKIVAKELPPPFAGKSGVQLITTHVMPVAFQKAGEPLLSASVAGGKLLLTNTGTAVARVSAIGEAGAKPELQGALGWVLPGTSRTFDYKPKGQVDVRLVRDVQTLPVAK